MADGSKGNGKFYQFGNGKSRCFVLVQRVQGDVRKPGRKIGMAGRADNRGVSFVEVIVSMLILAIAVIPLLGSFMMSFSVNMKSRQAMSATIVAQNVMECVKEYANTHTVMSGLNDKSDMINYLPKTYVSGNTGGGGGIFLADANGFTLKNVREGVNDFFVRVTYSGAEFSNTESTGINDRKIPDLTTLDADSTFIVCPPGVVDASLEKAAKTYFFDEWVARQWSSNADTEGYTGPTDQERAETRSDIDSRMESVMEIEVSGTKTSPKAKVLLYYRYDGISYAAYSHESSAGMTELENIYIFYDPLKIVGDTSGNCRIEDVVEIKNAGGFAWNLFFAVQESAECLGSYSAAGLSGPVFAMEQPYVGEAVGLFCSTELEDDQRVSIYGGTRVPGFEKLVDKQSLVNTMIYRRMQKVTVKVYRQGEKNTGSLLASMETDIMQ